ncbi:MAG: hypothetical protein GXX79_07385 [Actinomycetales bacterium]|nr:hypothetical protein [Actinomycetales bacterium]
MRTDSGLGRAMDDAAAEAVAGVVLDAAAIRRRAGESPAREATGRTAERAASPDGGRFSLRAGRMRTGRGPRRRAGGNLLVPALAAASVAVVAVGLAAVSLVVGSPVPADRASGPSGLPDRWWSPPRATPELAAGDMEVASMALASRVSRGAPDRLQGFVVVSGDGRVYRRLPWTRDDRAVTLSPDGRWVAWASERWRSGSRDPSVLHLLRVAGADRVDVPLPDLGRGGTAERIAWDTRTGGVVVTGYVRPTDGTGGKPRSWSVTATGKVSVLCECAPVTVGTGPGGGVVQVGAGSGAGRTGVIPGIPLATEQSDVDAEAAVGAEPALDPSGARFAWATDRATVAPGAWGVLTMDQGVVSGWGITAEGADVLGAKVLAWTGTGLVVQVFTGPRGAALDEGEVDGPLGVQILDATVPEGARSVELRVIAMGAGDAVEGSTSRDVVSGGPVAVPVVAVARDVVATTVHVPDDGPVATRGLPSGETVRTAAAWAGWTAAALGVLVLVLLGIGTVRRASRRDTTGTGRDDGIQGGA